MSWKTLCSEMEFLTQYPMVGLSISDSNSPVPGYLYIEINAITYIDYGKTCKPLVNFVVSRLGASTPFVSLKVLKLLLYLVKNGHYEMIEETKYHEVALKAAMGFYGNEDSLHGKTIYENIRALAKELLEYIFSEEKQINDTNPIPSQSELTGYGSNATQNKMPGFGYTAKHQKSISEIVTGGVTNLVEKLRTFPTQQDHVEEVSHIGDSLPQYKPLIIDKSSSIQDFTLCQTEKSAPENFTIYKKSKQKVHIPGRAGGGWDDSDDDIAENTSQNGDENKSRTSLDSTVSNELSKLDIKENLLNCVEEMKIVEAFVINESLNTMNVQTIQDLCKQCSSLNCDKVLSQLAKKLEDKEENIQLRSLIFMEYLLFYDVITLEALIKVGLPTLKLLTDNEEHIYASVKIKAKKVSLIIESLQKNQQKLHHSPTNESVSFKS